MSSEIKTRILFIAQSATLAHVTRSLKLVELLDLDRYEVFVATEKAYHALFEHLNIEMLGIDSGDMAEFRCRIGKGQTPFGVRAIEKQIAEDLRIIDYVRPQVVFGDLRNSLSVSARTKNVFYINISNAYWSPWIRKNPPFGLLGRFIMRIGLWIAILPYRKILKQVGRKFTDFREFYIDGDRTLFFDSPELVPLKLLTSQQHFCGPLLWSVKSQIPVWWTQLSPSKKWVFVGLGSSGQSQDLPMIVRALLRQNVEVVVATNEQIAGISSHACLHIAGALPLDKILERFDLVICNGGSPTSYAALNHGVPVLGIVSNWDQILAMSHIQDKEAGLLLRHGHLDDHQIGQAVKQMLSESKYKQNAKAIQKSFSRFNIENELGRLLIDVLES